MGKRTFMSLGGAAVVTCAAVVGYASASAESGDTDRRIPHVSSPRKINAPLNEYLPTAQEDSVILQARSTLTAQCVQRYGLPEPAPLIDPLTGMVRETAPLYLSEKTAAKYGYRNSGQNDLGAVPDPEPDSADQPSEAQKKAMDAVMNGWGNTPKDGALRSYNERSVSKTGCIGESDRKIMAGTTRPRINGGVPVTTSTQVLNLVLSLRSQAYQAMERDSRYQSMVRTWASCMKEHGYSYKAPEDARTGAQNMAPDKAGKASEKEIQLARRDATCQRDAKYLDVVGYLTEASQQAVMDEYREVLADVRENIDQRVAAAKKINAGAA
ncbi:hypothetical protein H1V43_26125 [Streptomyces sp. PSKA54]|uniref:Secreted protein n=1 Tax=Streptomyces himalayensis subsp. aureolus TaxID=2758039 RepID=A0A7W2HI89_9ACTN|nr:hypothetical protein [Streptomyces himalayensis]MBA4864766.1 hypothetical protein [Streptomyces himalayensis subsp. aureolus]